MVIPGLRGGLTAVGIVRKTLGTKRFGAGTSALGFGSLSTVLMSISVPALAAEPWEPFPRSFSYNDFGDVGLMQTPTARFAPDGQITLGGNRVDPYERYFFTVQGTPWFEATLRLTTVRNRLYSGVPAFSGDQSYKDRGFDFKLRVLEEGRLRPAVALGLRDFIGTNLFSSEYVVLNKTAGPVDLSIGLGWGNIASRGLSKNPFRFISNDFDVRPRAVIGGGELSNAYFKGKHVALFGGIKYDTPIKGLMLKAEYDSNDYKSEALNNKFRAPFPINIGFDYAVRSWLRFGAAFERGNRVGINLAVTTNFNRPFRIPKFDPPAPEIGQNLASSRLGADLPVAPTVPSEVGQVDLATPVAPLQPLFRLGGGARNGTIPVATELEKSQLKNALAVQGTGLYAADFGEREVILYVAQSRFRNTATGLGRVARAAYSVLPARYEAIQVVFVENGMEVIAARVYRSELLKALSPTNGSPSELLARTEFTSPPLALGDANFQAPLEKQPPRFYFSIRPALKTTLGRPEQFILYQAGIRLNGFLQVKRGLSVTGGIGVSLADNFDKLQIPSDSVLPHVRSDIKDYLREGKTSLAKLHADYAFNIAPSFYGHVYGGLLEEMYGGVGAEVLYRPATSNWALGADLSYVKQRDFDQRFDFRKYTTLTGFVTGARYFPGADIDIRVRLGRYLAKDYGGTLEVSRTFDSGAVIGAFVTKTNVSAAEFGEGRFDKGIFFSMPLDAIYVRNVRGSVGLTYRPLIRDGGQMLQIPQPLLVTTDEMTRAKFRRDWSGVDD